MAHARHRALVVDDELVIREALARSMSAESFHVETAADGREALAKVKENHYDLLVTDLRMPNKHGHALIMEVLQEDDPPHIVVLTGVAEPRLVKDLISRGVLDIVQKPVDFRVFAVKMQAIFQRRGWRDSLEESMGESVSSGSLTQIAKVEESLDLFSMCVPEDLIQLLAAAEESIPDPAATQVEFMHRIASKRDRKPDRRNSVRFSMLSCAVAMPASKDFEPRGEAFKMTFCDLSDSGACFMHTRSINDEYLALRWRSVISPKCHLHAVVQISRCMPLGPFYEIVGSFVMHD